MPKNLKLQKKWIFCHFWLSRDKSDPILVVLVVFLCIFTGNRIFITIFNDFAPNFGLKKFFFSKCFFDRKKKCQKSPKFIILHIFGQNWRFRGNSDPTHPGPKRVFVWFLKVVIFLPWSVGFFSHFFCDNWIVMSRFPYFLPWSW